MKTQRSWKWFKVKQHKPIRPDTTVHRNRRLNTEELKVGALKSTIGPSIGGHRQFTDRQTLTGISGVGHERRKSIFVPLCCAGDTWTSKKGFHEHVNVRKFVRAVNVKWPALKSAVHVAVLSLNMQFECNFSTVESLNGDRYAWHSCGWNFRVFLNFCIIVFDRLTVRCIWCSFAWIFFNHSIYNIETFF